MLKLTKGAISFLTAQYRAIYKRAYLKGLASVFALTVGTVPAVALASEITNNDYREVDNGQSLDVSKIVNNGTLKLKVVLVLKLLTSMRSGMMRIIPSPQVPPITAL